MKPTQLLLLAGAAIGGFLLFNSFTNKDGKGLAPINKKDPPKIKLGTPMYYQNTKKGITTNATLIYDKTTNEAKANIAAGITLSIPGAVNTDKGQMYIISAGYISTADVSITDHGNVEKPL